MSEDLRAAFELEARIIKDHGLLIPERCTCRHEVITSYPSQPWYFVALCQKHSLHKTLPNLDNPGRDPRTKKLFGWFTGYGERVSTAQLEAAFDALPRHGLAYHEGRGESVLYTYDGGVNRFGGVYYNNGTRYVEPG